MRRPTCAVNAVTPAFITTELAKQMTPEFIQFVVAKIPMGRPGEPHEVAALVSWLASEECSFSTGGRIRRLGRSSHLLVVPRATMRFAEFVIFETATLIGVFLGILVLQNSLAKALRSDAYLRRA